MLQRKVLEFGLRQVKSICVQQSLCLSTYAQKQRNIQTSRLATALQQHIVSVKNFKSTKRGIHSCPNQPQLIVNPSGFLLVDEELDIVLHGLADRQIITIHAVLTDEKTVYESYAVFEADTNGVISLARQPSRSGTYTVHAVLTDEKTVYESYAVFEADANGVISLARQPSRTGTYTGVSSMGLFWSMVPAPGQRKGVRLMKKNMDTPFKTILYVYNGEHSLEELHNIDQPPLLLSEIERWYKVENVTTKIVRDGNVRGKLFLPEGSGPFPGIIDLFGNVGGLTEHRAALFASRGFAALALPYFAYEDLPKTLDELTLDYFLEAIDWMLAHKKVHSQSVGVIGTSKGGDLALLMGAYSPKVSAVVNVNGHTFNSGTPLKYSKCDIPLGGIELDKLTTVDDAVVLKSAYTYSEKDLTPVWRYNPKVLHILSEDDYCLPTECIRLMKRCYPADKADNCTVLAYEKAGHLVEPPYSALCRMSYHKSFDTYFMWGGFPEEHARAQEHAWRSILSFFCENISDTLYFKRTIQPNERLKAVMSI